MRGLTASYLMRRLYDFKPGDSILLHAAAGLEQSVACRGSGAAEAVVEHAQLQPGTGVFLAGGIPDREFSLLNRTAVGLAPPRRGSQL